MFLSESLVIFSFESVKIVEQFIYMIETKKRGTYVPKFWMFNSIFCVLKYP